MPDIEEILSYFAENDPDLLPYAKQAMEELPGLREMYDVEDIAGEMLMSGCTPADALERLKRSGNAVAMELESEPNAGTTVTLRFPIRKETKA